MISCCLDRVMANSHMLSLFPASNSVFLELDSSDHRPIVTHLQSENQLRRRRFWYDNRMIDKTGFREAVIKGWKGSSNDYLRRIPIHSRIINCRKQISIWKCVHYKNAAGRITEIRSKLDNGLTSGLLTLDERKSLKIELNKAYEDEEKFWKNKSRVEWLQSGDRNMHYFQNCVKTRRTINSIHVIQNSQGDTIRGDSNIAQVAIDYFQSLYTHAPTNSEAMDRVFRGFQPGVTQ